MRGPWRIRWRPCGLIEAGGWVLLLHAVQALAAGLFLAVLVLASIQAVSPASPDLLKLFLQLELDRSFLLTGVGSVGSILFLVPLVRWRLGRGYRSLIGMQTPRRDEVIFALATVVPLAVIGDACYDLCRDLWVEGLSPRLGLEQVGESSVLQSLPDYCRGVSYPILIVALALGPAVGEELVFRGLIGRGLIHRYGAWKGVLLTSVLFGIAHLWPPQVLATIPVAIVLHTLYLQTRTIWIPVMVHTCNNWLAVSMVRFNLASDVAGSPYFLCGAIIYLAAMLVLLQRQARFAPLFAQPAT